MSVSQVILNLNLLADLKAAPVDSNAQVYIVGKTATGDGLGGFFYWDATSSTPEDLNTMNSVVSNVSASGRWIRVFQKTRALPQGILGLNGNMKVLYASGVTDSTGSATVNLTMDNTTTGTKIFSEIWFAEANTKASAFGPTNAIFSYLYAQSLTAVSFGFVTGKTATFALGASYSPFAAIGAEQTVNFKIEGV